MSKFFAKIFGRNASKSRVTPTRQRQLVQLWVEELTPRILPCAGTAAAALGSFSGHVAGLAPAADSRLTGGELCHHGDHGAAFTATLTNATGGTGSAQFNPTSGNLTVQVKGAAASSTLSVAFGGTTVGSITTDALGNGKTTISAAKGSIAAGTALTVGDLTGTFVQVQFTASLSGAIGTSGTGKFNVTKNVLHVTVTGAGATTTYNVSVDSAVVGQITTDANGAGRLKLTLPSGVTISAGTTLSVADTIGSVPILTGAFA